MPVIDYHMIKRSLTGPLEECGDTGLILQGKNDCILALVDVLGHGSEAGGVAASAEEYLRNHYKEDPVAIIQGLHEHLDATRGAVAGVCCLHIDTGIMSYSGIGNISIKIYGTKPRTLLTKDGVIGYMISSPVKKEIQLHPGDILVMTSDGIKMHFDPVCYPDMFIGKASRIAENLMSILARETDDASCIVLKYGV